VSRGIIECHNHLLFRGSVFSSFCCSVVRLVLRFGCIAFLFVVFVVVGIILIVRCCIFPFCVLPFLAIGLAAVLVVDLSLASASREFNGRPIRLQFCFDLLFWGLLRGGCRGWPYGIAVFWGLIQSWSRCCLGWGRRWLGSSPRPLGDVLGIRFLVLFAARVRPFRRRIAGRLIGGRSLLFLFQNLHLQARRRCCRERGLGRCCFLYLFLLDLGHGCL